MSPHLPQLGALPRLRIASVLLCLMLTAPRLQSQTFDATNLRVPAELGATGVAFAGDSPTFAQPDFDDSQWIPIDDKRPVRVIFPQPRPMVIWQRMHIKVARE